MSSKPVRFSNYNPNNWYWEAEDGRVYGSARGALVKDPAKDKDYQAWLKDYERPTRWPRDEDGKESDDELKEVLRPYGLVPGEKPKAGASKDKDSAAVSLVNALVKFGILPADKRQDFLDELYK